MRLLSIFMLWLLLVLSCVSTNKRSLAERYYNVATDYYKEKNYKQAVAYYELALKEDPNLKVVFLNYGLALIEVNNESEAIQQLIRAAALDPRNTLAMSALGYLNFRIQKYQNAAEWYRKAIDINPYNPQTFYNLGITEQYIGNYEAAQNAFDKVLQLEAPKDRPKELRRFVALNQLHLGNEENAMELYQEYFVDNGNDEKVFQDVYDLYSKTQQYEKLQETFSFFEKSVTNSPLASFLLAELYYLKLDQPQLGLEQLKNAVERRFSDQDSINKLVKKLKSPNRQAAEKLLLELTSKS